jgi:hypothetical protein
MNARTKRLTSVADDAALEQIRKFKELDANFDAHINQGPARIAKHLQKD